MIPKLNKELLNTCYSSARNSYTRCIENPENTFLSEEIGRDIFTIRVKNASVSIKFHGMDPDMFVLEVKLLLLSEEEEELGYYKSVLDPEYNEIDQFLVIH